MLQIGWLMQEQSCQGRILKKKVPFKLLALRNLKKTQQLLGHDQAKTKKCTI